MKKKWYQSKTIWSAIAIGIVGVLRAFELELPYEAIVTALGAFGLYGVRDALK